MYPDSKGVSRHEEEIVSIQGDATYGNELVNWVKEGMAEELRETNAEDARARMMARLSSKGRARIDELLSIAARTPGSNGVF